MGTQVILASASPRRRELLKRWLDEYTVLPADIDETLPEGMPVSEGPGYLALHKARHLAEKYPEALVIGCDTGVMIDGRMLGKPRDRSEARQMLEELSGRLPVLSGTGTCISGCDAGGDVSPERGGDRILSGYRRIRGQSGKLRDPGKGSASCPADSGRLL